MKIKILVYLFVTLFALNFSAISYFLSIFIPIYAEHILLTIFMIIYFKDKFKVLYQEDQNG